MYEKIISNYQKNDKSSLIALLQDIQESYGYLPEDILYQVSEFVNMPFASVYGVAAFYNQFRLAPLGKYVIRVCRGTACHVKNSANVLIALENELGITAGCTSRDKLFTLETVACIGVLSIERTSVFFASIFGGKIFSEHYFLKKGIAIIIMLVGAYLVT